MTALALSVARAASLDEMDPGSNNNRTSSDGAVFCSSLIDRSRSGWKAAFVEQFNENGIVTLEDVRDRASFLALLADLGDLCPHRDSEPDGLTRIASNGAVLQGIGYRGFTSEGMDVHTDRSGVPNPPAMLSMWCQQQALEGGESVLVDAKAVFDRCRKYSPSLLEDMRRPNSVVFGGPRDPYVGSVFEQQPDLSWTARFRSDELGFFLAPPSRATTGTEGDVRLARHYVPPAAGTGLRGEQLSLAAWSQLIRRPARDVPRTAESPNHRLLGEQPLNHLRGRLM